MPLFYILMELERLGKMNSETVILIENTVLDL